MATLLEVFCLRRCVRLLNQLAPAEWRAQEGLVGEYRAAAVLIRKRPPLLVPSPELSTWSRRAIVFRRAAVASLIGLFITIVFLNAA